MCRYGICRHVFLDTEYRQLGDYTASGQTSQRELAYSTFVAVSFHKDPSGPSDRQDDRCVHNLCVNNARRRPLVSLGDEPYAEVKNLTADLTELSTATSVEIRERWSEVEGAVDQLAPNQRNAFLLAEVRGYRYDEIAESMNRSTNSVRQLLSRARKKIRKISNAGSDWVGIPTPALQAGLAFARDVRFSVDDVLDRAQEKVINAQAWLGNIFHNAQAVLQYGAYIVAGAAVIVLGKIDPKAQLLS